MIHIMYFNDCDCPLFSDAVSSQEEQIDAAEVSLIVFGFSTIENCFSELSTTHPPSRGLV